MTSVLRRPLLRCPSPQVAVPTGRVIDSRAQRGPGSPAASALAACPGAGGEKHLLAPPAWVSRSGARPGSLPFPPSPSPTTLASPPHTLTHTQPLLLPSGCVRDIIIMAIQLQPGTEEPV